MKIVCSIFFCAVLLLAGGCFSVAPAKSPELPAEKSKIIILDPGHGGHDPGAAGVFSQEKNLNLALALAVGIIAITTLTRMQTALRRKLKSPEFHSIFH